MADQDIVGTLLDELSSALAPLRRALDSPDGFAAFMRELGWDLASVPQALGALGPPLATLDDLLADGAVDVDRVPAVLDALRGALEAIAGLGSATGLPGTVDAAAFTAEFPREVVDYLLVEYLLDCHAPWGEVLKLLGVIRLEEVLETPTRRGYIKRAVAWEDLARVLDDPTAVFTDAYAWGQPTFDQETFMQNVADFGRAVGLPAVFAPLDAATSGFLLQGATTPLDDVHDWAVQLPLIEAEFGPADVTAGVGMFPLPGSAEGPPGFSILPYAEGLVEETIDVTEHVAIILEAGVDAAGGIGILVRPGVLPELYAGILTGPTRASAAVGVGVVVHGTDGAPVVLAGSAEASRLELRSASATSGARAALKGDLDAFIEIDLQGARLIVKPAEGSSDGFLASLLPPDGIVIDVALLVGLSVRQGLYFGGSGGLEIALPAHVSLGPIEITGASIAIRPKAGVIPVELGATMKGDLGPLKAVVEDVGLRVDITFPADRKGNLGVANLALGFKPPKGVGLSIDAGVVKGGGYLFIDVDRGEYAGALELTVADFLSLKAIGLISTRMPDGSAGFSLLVIITAEFGTGLQLGYGFVLIGVGGLLGLNRTMLLEPLMQGVRSGAVNGIMFPRDIVANAPRIISDLRAIFPPKVGTFLIGPMAKLGWGSPTIVSVSLGVIIEIPGNVAIVGVLELALPDPDDPVVVIRVNFAGAIEFDKKRLFFFAALFESRILFMTLEGEMGLLVAVGDQPDFVVSVGGFHPAFKPPPLPFPSPRRIALTILDQDNAKIRAETYMAVTSNTAQFGAAAELHFGFSAFSIEGHFAFDALIQFSPFSFVIEISASVSMQAFGVGVFSIRLHLALEGPTPWRARGTGSLQLLFFEISADFDVTWGEARNTALPPIPVLPLLLAELAKPQSWRALLPASANLLVTLRTPAVTAGTLVLHPLGALQVAQGAVPLDLTIARVGQQRPSDANRFTVRAAGTGLDKTGDVNAEFAPAQFQDLDDAAKLSRPSFEQQRAGVELSVQGQELRSARAVARSLRYEEITIDTAYRRRRRRFSVLTLGLFTRFLTGNSATRSELSKRRRDERQPFATTIVAREETYVVASARDNTAVATFVSESAARDDLAARLAAEPGLAGELHVIPAQEAVAA